MPRLFIVPIVCGQIVYSAWNRLGITCAQLSTVATMVIDLATSLRINRLVMRTFFTSLSTTTPHIQMQYQPLLAVSLYPFSTAPTTSSAG